MAIQNLRKVFLDRTKKNYEKGQIVMYSGDDFTNTFYVEHGYVKMYDINSQGDERILMIFAPGDIMPIPLNIFIPTERLPLKYFYEAMTDLELYQMPRSDFEYYVHNDPKQVESLARYLSGMTLDLIKRISIIESKDAKNKIVLLFDYLIKTCAREIHPRVFKIKFRITHQDIASLTGISRETASTQIKKLEREGVLEQNKDGRMVIKSLTA